MEQVRDRRAVLADAAIELLAQAGMRALTHRAVDARAGLPQGTTSAYFRTRKALVTAAVQRLADLDRIELARGGLLPAHPAPGAPDRPLAVPSLDTLAEAIAAFIDHWLGAGRHRALARYACLLESIRYPELRDILAPHETAARAQTRELLAAAGAPDPERRARDLVACIDGLIFDRLVGTGATAAPPPGTPEARNELAATVRTLLHAAIHA